MNTPDNTGQSDGVGVTVTYRDGRAETVRVRVIPRSELIRYAELLVTVDGDETAEAGFYAGRDATWANGLSDESFNTVVETGQRLNFANFEAWLKRQNRKLEAVNKNSELIRLAKAAGFTAPNKPN